MPKSIIDQIAADPGVSPELRDAMRIDDDYGRGWEAGARVASRSALEYILVLEAALHDIMETDYGYGAPADGCRKMIAIAQAALDKRKA